MLPGRRVADDTPDEKLCPGEYSFRHSDGMPRVLRMRSPAGDLGTVDFTRQAVHRYDGGAVTVSASIDSREAVLLGSWNGFETFRGKLELGVWVV